MAFVNATIENYNLTAGEYAEKVKDLHPVGPGVYFLSRLDGSKKVLDLGCGSGRDARVFTQQGCQVTGLDLSSKLLDIARLNSPESNFILGDMLKLPFPKNLFDGIWSCASLLHLPKSSLPTCLAECHRVLKNGGIFYVGVKEGVGEESKPDLRYGKDVTKFYSYFQQEELRLFLTRAGFSIDQSSIYHWPKGSYVQHPEVRIFARKLQTETLKNRR